jgi:sugar lactone lactonase YvrE
VADSAAGAIWRFDPATGALALWQRDDAYAPDPAVQPFRPGVNGLKFFDGALYASNTSRGALYRVALAGDGAPAGMPVRWAAPGPIDDFTFDEDGAAYAATHGATLLRVTADGAVEPVLREGCDACTSVAFAGEGAARKLYVLTTGNLLEGGDAPARVLAVAVGARVR